MIALLIDKSSSFEIILVGILYLMLFEKNDNSKLKK